ncbi:MAG: penicillin-binding protein 2 [Candidatus Limnocylindrales bacterium]
MSEPYLLPHRERDRRPIRFVAFGLAMVMVFSLLTVRLGYLQITNGRTYATMAEANRSVTVAIPSSRGLIYDRKGRLLVANVASYAVRITPADLPWGQRDAVAAQLGALLNMQPSDILATVDSATGSQFDPVKIKQDVPKVTADVISESVSQLPGVSVAIETRREYTTGTLMSHILGYTSQIDPATYARLRASGYLPDDAIGQAGLEASFESVLRGTYGQQVIERDATGKDLQVLKTTAPVQGASLTLTIDTTVQKEALRALQWGMKAAHLKRGVFIAMNPQTGEVLAMVSLPTYDDNLFAKGISQADFQKLATDKTQPLIDNSVQSQFAPGSTFKLVTGSGGLQDKKLTATSKIRTAAYIVIAGTKFWDWNHQGWGMCNIACGFGNSSDTFFYQVATMLGSERLSYYAHAFGFGQPTGIDLPGEASGIIPSNQWKVSTFGQPMFAGETAQAGIGQGYVAVTPIQLINAYTALANGGKLYRPQIVETVTGPDGNVIQPFKPDLIRRVPVSAANLRTMRLAARASVTIRHTYNLVDMPIKVAGKSGTAEFGIRDKLGRLPYHSWFVGWVNKDPTSADFTKTDSQLMFLAFAYSANTIGNAATEIAKDFLQIHYHIRHNYLIPALMVTGNFAGQG